MLLGTYSIPHLHSMYQDPEQRKKLNNYILAMIIALILWFTAIGLLIYYWNNLDLWAKIFAIIGLFFNAGGSIFSILVIYLGLNENNIPEKSSINSPFAVTLIPTKDNSSLNVVPETISIQDTGLVTSQPEFNEDIPL